MGGQVWWGICVLLPVVANTFLTMLLWSRMEDETVKHWTWVLVLAQVWPQYRALKVIWMYWAQLNEEKPSLIEAERYKVDFQRGISTLEPYVESVPQVLILSNILLKTSVIGTCINKAEVTEELEMMTGNTRWVFYCTFSLSILTASLGRLSPCGFKMIKTHNVLCIGFTFLPMQVPDSMMHTAVHG